TAPAGAILVAAHDAVHYPRAAPCACSEWLDVRSACVHPLSVSLCARFRREPSWLPLMMVVPPPVGMLASLAALVLLAAGTPGARAQVGFDRPGGDYADFVVRSGDPAVCANRCDRDNRCRAWSFAYPTTFATRAVCWLKSSVPPRVESTCCI